MQTAVHQDCVKTASYRSLIDAANGISLIVRVLPQNTAPSADRVKTGIESMPSTEEVQQVRKAFDEITVLCQGYASRGIVGWHECFSTVKELMER